MSNHYFIKYSQRVPRIIGWRYTKSSHNPKGLEVALRAKIHHVGRGDISVIADASDVFSCKRE